MEIKNEEHARKMIAHWNKMPMPACKREIRIAIETLELNQMYYEQKNNEKGMLRAEKCILILKDHLGSIEE